MNTQRALPGRPWCAVPVLALLTLGLLAAPAPAAAQPTNAILVGEIIQVTVDDPGDVWSGGTLVVDGQNVTLPRNLLVDLPANRLTLQQIFAEAPGVCATRGESGLARNDTCRDGEPGAHATVLANRTAGGNVIAGELFIAKADELVSGVVTYIDHTDGYFRLSGEPGDPTTGVMVRINDPGGRHTVQQGLGCDGISPNCSPDARFGLDDTNYTITFTTGYPACIPSTETGGNRVTGSDANGNGDPFCPQTNRTVNNGIPVDDSTRFAPLRVGDHVVAEGDFATVSGVRFLSAHTVDVGVALTTQPGGVDYLIFDEVEWDVPGFQNERVRALMIVFTTLPDSQLDIFALHFDPIDNLGHEYPLASTVNNADTINQGIPPNPGHIAKVTYDVDFVVGAVPGLSPCRNLNNAGFGACASVPTLAEEFSILSPVAREIIARSRNRQANPSLQAFDLAGNDAPWGEYLTPVGLGHPEFVEIDLRRTGTPFIFAGIPWNLDRRLGPGGCDGACEGFPQPLDPFPYSQLDPRTQAAIPTGVENEVFAFHPFGPSDFLAWPPADPGGVPVLPTPDPIDACDGANRAPLAGNDAAVTPHDAAVVIDVAANDSDVDGFIDPASVTIVSPAGDGGAVANGDGTVTYTPDPAFTGEDAFTYTVADNLGAISNQAIVRVTVEPDNVAPTAANDGATTEQDMAIVVDVLANDTDSDGFLDTTTVTIVSPASNGGTVVNPDGTVTYTPDPGFNGGDSFSYTVDDDDGATSNTAVVSVTVDPPPTPDQLTVTQADWNPGPSRWRVNGTATVTIDNQVTIYLGPTVGGQIIGIAVVQPDGSWEFEESNHPIGPDASNQISIESSAGGVLEGIPVT